jgi:quercetin dioxygenase-like cupin family protein
VKGAYRFLGSLALVRLSGEDTDGRYCLVEWLTPAGDMTQLHVHEAQQTVYVLEGEVTFYLPGVVRVCGPGELSHHPAGVTKTERVTSSSPARMLDVNAPAGFDSFVAAAGEPTEELALPPPPLEPPDFERIAALARENGIEILGPPGDMP